MATIIVAIVATRTIMKMTIKHDANENKNDTTPITMITMAGGAAAIVFLSRSMGEQ